ncbi:hypothetical protein [Lewinella sp. 4G2]|uniref:hypothetical protein n=1 Tax=Lewinella sp. 4G2 TaxID=1803372 RepID=UPI0007B481E9|nr:hypothetical protein [Lewinella sp. 4G2]OAV45012.1 hypothetical protein A3850_011165 [Lewinella sp. 4G2]
MYRLQYCLFCLLMTGSLFAQLPNTQVYVFDMAVRDTSITFSKPLYVSGFNPKGYNNQPGWIDRNNLLMTVAMPGDDQPEIYKMDLARRKKTRLTATASGEFSPKVMSTGTKFSAVRQEVIGQDTVLRLWEFPLDLTTNGKPVFSQITGTGYYEWLNSVQLALFQVEDPSKLMLAATDNGAPTQLAKRIGRSFARQPNGNLAYVDKSRQPWRIVEKSLYRLNDPATLVTEVRPGSEDFSILPDGSYIMGQGSKLYRFDPLRNPRWVELTDLRLYGIRGITRISTNNFGRIAIVATGR